MSASIALVTGANKGIGFETARQLGRRGYAVIMAARDSARGNEAAEKLRQEGLDTHFVQLDVTSPQSAHIAAEWVQSKFGRLDVLINNAGIVTERAGFLEADLDMMRQTFETNVFGVVAVTQAFVPLLRKSAAGRVVNVSSGLGSLTHNANPHHPYAAVNAASYNASKAALNMLTIILARELQSSGIKVNAADPGYTKTDINGNQGTQTVQEGTEAIIHLATLESDGPTAGYFDRNGVVPW